MEPDAGIVVLYATFPGRDAALSTGRALVEAGLAGCANVLPAMTSCYVWQGVVETAEEAVLIAKAESQRAEAAVAFIAARHSYDVPAIVVLPVIGGFAPYIAWVKAAAPVPQSNPPG